MTKKIPVRQCLGCREHKPKKELLRVVRSPEGAVALDLRGKANVKSNALARALETEIPPEVLESLLKEMEEADGTE